MADQAARQYSGLTSCPDDEVMQEVKEGHNVPRCHTWLYAASVEQALRIANIILHSLAYVLNRCSNKLANDVSIV